MLPHVLSVALAHASTSGQYRDNYTSYLYGNALAVLVYKALNGFVTTVPGGQLPNHNHWPHGDLDRLMFQEPAQVWVIDPSLLLVHVCGTIYDTIRYIRALKS